MKRHLSQIVEGLLFLVLTTPIVGQEKNTDWPQFRGPSGFGSTSQNLPTQWSATENIAWKVELPGAGASTPIIVGDRVVLTYFSGYGEGGRGGGDMEKLKLGIVCLDRSNGKILWDETIPPMLPEQKTIREGHGYASGTPACDGSTVYASFGRTGAFAFDLKTGKKLWQADLGSQIHEWGSAASPVLHGDLVTINASVESESLVALSKKTGKEVWRAKGIKESWSTPILVEAKGKQELVVPIFGKILGFDPETGKELWSCATDISWYMVPCLVADKDMIYCIGGRSGGALAVRAGGRGDVTKSDRIWKGTRGSNVSSPVLHEGYLYWMNDNNGTAYCAEAKTGKVIYEERVERADQVYAAALLANGNVYYVSRTGRTFVVAAKPEYKKVATNDLSDRSMFNASPAAAGNQLFIRSDRYLYCVGK